VDKALVAIRVGSYDQAAVMMQSLRSDSRLTANQLTAVQDTMAMVQQRLVLAADTGDTNAQNALNLIRVMRR
jgi:hypothetical protein